MIFWAESYYYMQMTDGELTAKLDKLHELYRTEYNTNGNRISNEMLIYVEMAGNILEEQSRRKYDSICINRKRMLCETK